ncbi:MAG: nucleoid-associated protein [Defluviitaleaceae bacterium]|nr:nucleoid-associated protein [Defluviitaleaceae bacterium]
MSLKIRNAILHILHNDGRPSVFSEAELDIDSEVCEAFITKHVKKLLDNAGVRTATFKSESPLYSLLGAFQQGNAYFKETAAAVAHKLDEIMNRYPSIPPCDLLIARVGSKKGEYLAILQLGYQAVYAHKSKNSDNQLTMCTALPFSSGKVEYAALIALDGPAMPISITEKPAVIDGEAMLYFSELFLECDPSPSKKEQAKLIDEINIEFVDEYYSGNPSVHAQIKTALMEEAEDAEGFVSMDNVAAQIFEPQDELKLQYVNTMREAGVADDLPLGQKVVRQQFGTQRIKAENGVEIKFPSELAAAGDNIEITTHGDGTVTVLFKHLKMV